MDNWCYSRIKDYEAHAAYKKQRCAALVGVILEFSASIAGLIIYAGVRRARMLLILSVINILLATVGLFGALMVRKWMVLVHGILMTAGFGGFYIF